MALLLSLLLDWIFLQGRLEEATRLALDGVPLACAIAAACVVSAWCFTRRGIAIGPSTAPLSFTMRRLALPAILAWPIVFVLLLEGSSLVLGGPSIFEPDNPEFFLVLATADRNLLLAVALACPLVAAVFLAGVLPASRRAAVAGCWAVPLVPLTLGLVHSLIPDGLAIGELTLRLPFAESGVRRFLFRLYPVDFGSTPFAAWTLLAAIVLFALRFGGLYEILMQRYHDRHLAGLGPYDAPPLR